MHRVRVQPYWRTRPKRSRCHPVSPQTVQNLHGDAAITWSVYVASYRREASFSEIKTEIGRMDGVRHIRHIASTARSFVTPQARVGFVRARITELVGTASFLSSLCR